MLRVGLLMGSIWLLPAVALAQDTTIEGVVGQAKDAYGAAGLWGLLGVLVAGVIGLYRSRLVDGLLHPTARWSAWPRWAKIVAVFALTAAPPLGYGLGTGVPWPELISHVVSAITAAFTTAELAKTAMKPGSKSPEALET